jgi:SAM-dependent methyltransferase
VTRPQTQTSPQSAPASDTARYRGFWSGVGSEFPDLGGALSTTLYRENERWLIRNWLPETPRLLKTDLWDECKNTRILQWAATQGARAHGVDISEPTVRQAVAEFPPGALRGVVGDTRRLPFRGASFDAIYSMGTIEHFADPGAAVEDMHRVLRPGGRAIIGVPNRCDPFLRPLLVALLYKLGLYDYGYERSFTRGGLRRLVEKAGLHAVAETGILFIPGWLRMFELFCRDRLPWMEWLAAAMVRPFLWIDRLGFLRRYGYLIVCVAEKAGASPPSGARTPPPPPAG